MEYEFMALKGQPADASLVETAEQAERIYDSPGIYVAMSGTPAHPLLQAMALVGDVKLLGTKQWEDGTESITVRMAGTQRQQNNPAIGIGREFFVTALKDYKSWQEKWFREAVQNSIDAGATRIDIRCDEQTDGDMLVSCEDNGGGMSREVLIDKFLVLGGTTKTGARLTKRLLKLGIDAVLTLHSEQIILKPEKIKMLEFGG